MATLNLRSKEKGDAGSSLFLGVGSQRVHATVNVVLSLNQEERGKGRRGKGRRGGMEVCNMVKP